MTPAAAEARENCRSWDYLINSGEVCVTCGGTNQIACESGDACDGTRGMLQQLCVTSCGGSGEPRCDSGCDAGVSTVPLDPVRPSVFTAMDAYAETIANEVETIEAAIDSGVRAQVPGFLPDFIEEAIEDDIISDILSEVPSPSTIRNDLANEIDYCYTTAPQVFDRSAHPSWPKRHEPAGRRTAVLIHGRLGGGYSPAPTAAPGIDPLVTRTYMVDYNGSGESALPMRVFEQRANGSVDPTPVYTGPMSDGTNFTIHSVAEFVYQALAALPIDGDLLIVGHSQGGFVTKDLIYHHYDDLRIAGHPIAKVVFLGHPHYGIVADPGVYLPFVCSASLIGYMPPTPPRSPQENAQDCASARWMLGWRNAAAPSVALTPHRRPTFDNRDLPQIEWLTVSGNTGLGTILTFPYFFEITGVVPGAVLGDGMVPTLSAEGIDEFDKFPQLGDLQFDRVISTLVGHGYEDLEAAVLAVAPDAFAGAVECGDLDGDTDLGGGDLAALRQGLAGGLALSPDQVARCSVAPDAGCDIVDVAVLARWLAGLGRGEQACTAAAKPPADAVFFVGPISAGLSDWETAWANDPRSGLLGMTEWVPTSRAAVQSTREIQAAVADNQVLCGAANPDCTLTFAEEVTGLCRDVRVRSFDPFTFNDVEGTKVWPGDTLSIGDVDNSENDDFEIQFDDPDPPLAMAFLMMDNTAEPGESLIALDPDGHVLGALDSTQLPSGDLWVGMIASRPIASVFFDEHPGGDDIAIRDVRWLLEDVDADGVAECALPSGVTLYTNEATWTSAMGGTESFPTTASNLAFAPEQPAAPGVNQVLCGSVLGRECLLNYAAADTGLCRDFQIYVRDGATFADDEIPGGGDSISPGDAGAPLENDDFEFHFGPPYPRGFGFRTVNNDVDKAEAVRVRDPDGRLIAVIREDELPVSAGEVFLGVVSAEPIGSVEFDEDPGDDDIAFRHLRFDDCAP